jgi:TonB family protein
MHDHRKIIELRMKYYCAVFLISFVAAVKAADNEYAVTQTGAYIILNNGLPAAINQGSCFRFVKDDPSHTFVQLKVGDSTFWIRKASVSIVPQADNQAAAAKYAAEVELATKTEEKLSKNLHPKPEIRDIVKAVAAIYPYGEKMRKHEGSGLFHLTLDQKTGVVSAVNVKKSTGFKSLDDSATTALRQWQWIPGSWKEIDIPMTFKLMGRGTREAYVLPTEL